MHYISKERKIPFWRLDHRLQNSLLTQSYPLPEWWLFEHKMKEGERIP